MDDEQPPKQIFHEDVATGQTFSALIGIAGHLRTQCINCLTTTTAASPTAPVAIPMASTTTTTLTMDVPHNCVPLPSITAISIVLAAASAATVTIKTTILANDQDALDGASTITLAITTPTSSDRDSVSVCPH
nr:unnamed protein product [Spirometra erinaceieuropaei]